MKKYSIWALFLSLFLTAQENKNVTIDFSGYMDIYYAYDFSKPETEQRLPFLYSHNRHNEFALNIALARIKASYENVYGTLSFHSGSYVEDNYASEKVKYINEAFLGIYLNSSKKDVLEIGILPSYIGFETAVSHSNLTLTRSILADNSPYFMTGAKYGHHFNDKVTFSFLVTNGWQRIQKAQPTISPSFGTQLVLTPTAKTTINWSTFLGKETYADQFSMRYFSNLYWDQKWNDKWRTILGFDCGYQQKPNASYESKTWMSPVLIAQYTLNKQWQIGIRSEYYSDIDNAIVVGPLPFETFGNSLNLDFLPNAKFKLRTEAKWYSASENIVATDNKNSNFCITSGVSFEF